MRLLSTLALILAACTSPNPNFAGGAGGGNADLAAGASGDLAFSGPADLSGPMGSCTQGERKCAATSASDRCERGLFVVDRECPNRSVCRDTYCAPPTTMLPTQIGQRCDAGGAQQAQCSANKKLMLACQPFIDSANKSVQWFCGAPVGTGGAGASCTSGAQCQSGFCGASGTCFVACLQDLDCGANLKCNNEQIVVEEVRVQANSCGP